MIFRAAGDEEVIIWHPVLVLPDTTALSVPRNLLESQLQVSRKSSACSRHPDPYVYDGILGEDRLKDDRRRKVSRRWAKHHRAGISDEEIREQAK